MFRFPRGRAFQRVPVGRLHQVGPSLVELAMIAFAEAIVADPGAECRIEPFVTKPHPVVERHAPRHHAATRLGAFLPVVHVILLERAGWTEATDSRLADRSLDLRRR